MVHAARVGLIVMATWFVAGNVMAVEEAKYSVLRQEDAFELREYESHVLAETIVDAEFEDLDDDKRA